MEDISTDSNFALLYISNNVMLLLKGFVKTVDWKTMIGNLQEEKRMVLRQY